MFHRGLIAVICAKCATQMRVPTSNNVFRTRSGAARSHESSQTARNRFRQRSTNLRRDPKFVRGGSGRLAFGARSRLVHPGGKSIILGRAVSGEQ